MDESNQALVQARVAGERMNRLVAVGVDGTAANWSAVWWAVAEARRSAGRLLLVACAPGDPEQGRPDRLARDLLEQARSRIAVHVDDVSTRVVSGEPDRALVRAAEEDTLLVVGKRRGHPASHAVLGSTSIAVAKRCRGPVVVVPEDWSVREHRREPVVTGIRGGCDSQVLDFAFERAQRLGVGLVVVYAWGLPTELLEVVAPWREAYPDVKLRSVSPSLSPAVSLVGIATTNAQLLVLGRHTSSRSPGAAVRDTADFAVDAGASAVEATIEMVLHHAPCPVAVVPSSSSGLPRPAGGPR